MAKKISNFSWLIWIFYFLLFCLYAVFSFSLTDPNLVLTTWAPYWHFQQWMWQTFFNNAPLLTETYSVLIAFLFGTYFFAVRKGTSLPKKNLLLFFLAFTVPLLFSYNALSHDVFNYIFNAKMVLVYHTNPHVDVALNHSTDLWLRFMHNVHTPAPYGYGWTAFSLLPYAVGLNKFLPTWIIFRLLSVLGIVLLYFSFRYLARQIKQEKVLAQFFILFLNPLFLIEMVSNSHNDLWMLVPAILALALVAGQKKANVSKILFSFILLAFSISTKLATALLVPVWFLLVIENQKISVIENLLSQLKLQSLKKFFLSHWPTISAVLLFIPLLTDRSEQFQPWYLTWVLVWIPFIPQKCLRHAILILSVSSMFRYIPWLWNGGFSDQIIFQQKLITWIPVVLYLVVWFFFSLSRKKTVK